jgi:hypothetical protein
VKRRLASLAVAALLLGLASPVPAKGNWKTCLLEVTNKTPYRALIHVDGVYWGWVNAQQVFTFKGVPEGDILAYGTTQYGEFYWGPQPIKCQGTAPWTLSF